MPCPKTVLFMKATSMRKLCLLLVVASVSLLTADDPSRTFGLNNGRFWNSLPNVDTRHTFVMGLLDGWGLRGNTEEATQGRVINAMTGGSHFRTDYLVSLVTSVYADVENLPLPVGWVVMGCLAV